MELINKLIKIVEDWAKPLPHLPVKAQKWIATNIWWINAIVAGLAALAIIFGIIAIFTALSMVNSVNMVYGGFYKSPIVYGGWWISTSTISLIISGITLGILASAIKPLKEMRFNGWRLLFIMFIVNLASSLFSLLASFSIFSFISGLFFAALYSAIGLYLLLEIKSHFTIKK